MRKRYWVLLGMLLLGGGNLIGDRDGPGTVSVDRAGTPATVQVGVPAAPRFDGTMYVSASSLNLRGAPGTDGSILRALPRNTRVQTGERRGDWVLVSAQGQVGWVNAQYLTGTPIAPAISVPTQSQPGRAVVQSGSSASCPGRLTCGQIGSCREARWYLANCSWGYRLDGDSDGMPCEAMCR